jgi:prepilin-type N-terminal cleavage/methylation domain-containing protein
MKSSRGFTLVELIISIFVLTVALIGVYSAFIILTILVSSANDRLTGAYLAQEGIEIVMNIRDNNWIKDPITPNDWRCGLIDISTEGLGAGPCDNKNIDCTSGCEADYTTMGTAESFMRKWPTSGDGGNPGYYLKTDISPTGNGFYNYSSGTNTRFKRKITVSVLPSPYNHIIKVTVDVSWDEKSTIVSPGNEAGKCGSSNCITAVEYLYNWYPAL